MNTDRRNATGAMQFSIFHQFLTQANIQMQEAGAEAWFYAEISSRF